MNKSGSWLASPRVALHVSMLACSYHQQGTAFRLQELLHLFCGCLVLPRTRPVWREAVSAVLSDVCRERVCALPAVFTTCPCVRVVFPLTGFRCLFVSECFSCASVTFELLSGEKTDETTRRTNTNSRLRRQIFTKQQLSEDCLKMAAPQSHDRL